MCDKCLYPAETKVNSIIGKTTSTVMSSQISIPNWLDEKFITTALRDSEGKNIKVKQIQVRAATSPGDNYASSMYRVVVNYDVDEGHDLKVCTKFLIVKADVENENLKKLITESNVFSTESEVLWKIVPAMLRLLNMSGEPVYIGPRCYYFSDKPPHSIIMEDLLQSGFKMASRVPGLDLDHSRLVVSRLGVFHAASVALLSQAPGIFDNFLTHIEVKAGDSSKNFIQQSFRNITEVVQTLPEHAERYCEKLRQLSETAFQQLVKCVERDDQGFNVLNHGDAWTNNMMFKYNEDGQVTDMIFLDFQCCYYGSPVVDLQYFLYTSPTPEVRRLYMDNLVEFYHSSLSYTLTRLGCKVKCPSLNELQMEMKRKVFLSIFAFFAVRALISANSDNIADIGSMLENSHHTSLSHLTDNYKKELLEFLPILEQDS